jgi:serine/threonine-protein kinase
MRTARKNAEMIPPRIVAAIMCGVLLGLHAAHDTKGLDGQLLGVVHRDVSPQNVIVGADGTARVLDFGIAKAAGRAQVTREGQIKGKLAYMAPEQIRGQVDRRTDVFAAAVVLWEMLAGRRLHEGAKDVDIVTRVVQGNFPPPSQFAPGLAPEIDEIVLRALATDPKKRMASARDLALELERKVGLASPSEVSEWVERLADDVLQARTS